MHVYLGNTYNVANSHHLVSHFLTIQAYLFREYLQYGEQSSPGFPFFFFFFHVYKRIYLGNTYNVANSHHLVSHFFFKLYKHIFFGNTYNVANSHHLVSHFFLTIQAYLFREYLQCGEQSSPGFPFVLFCFFFL